MRQLIPNLRRDHWFNEAVHPINLVSYGSQVFREFLWSPAKVGEPVCGHRLAFHAPSRLKHHARLFTTEYQCKQHISASAETPHGKTIQPLLSHMPPWQLSRADLHSNCRVKSGWSLNFF
jgi:hypothetical protein